MGTEKLSSFFSLLAALVVAGASFLQWWNVSYDGKLITKLWVKAMLVCVIVLLLASIYYLFKV
jgi:hypothetical protein